MREDLVLGGEGGRGHVGHHEPGVQAALAGEEGGQAGERRVHEPLGAALADRAEVGGGDGQQVGGDRHRLAVEVPARQDLARLREDHGVVGGGVHLDLVDAGHVAERVPRGAVHLRHAAQAVGVLDAAAVAVRLAHGAAREQDA